MRLFSPDSPMMQALGRICDLVILNFLFIFTCLPVFTIGSASAALYDMCFRMIVDEEGGIVKGYFLAFVRNFRQATPVFLVLALFLALTGFNAAFFGIQRGAILIFGYVFLFAMALGCMVWAYAFPLVSRFQNTLFGTLKNALFLSIGYFPRTLGLLILNLLPAGLMFLQPGVFFEVSILWVIVYFAAAAYVNTLLLNKVFTSLLPQANEAES